MTTTRCYRCALRTLVIGSFVSSFAAMCGCGNTIINPTVARTVLAAECTQGVMADTNTTELIVLSWAGGTSPIYPDVQFEGLDFSEFAITDGDTLADDIEYFKEQVRLEITNIYCDCPNVAVVIRNNDDPDTDADTVVLITEAIPPSGGTDIGEAEYDPCDRQHDNSALIFGKRVRQLGGRYSFNDWVMVFANVCAHEIAHTLGYPHAEPEDCPGPEECGFVELMLARHTMAQMTEPQGFVAKQTNCSTDAPRSAYFDQLTEAESVESPDTY